MNHLIAPVYGVLGVWAQAQQSDEFRGARLKHEVRVIATARRLLRQIVTMRENAEFMEEASKTSREK
jgi:hypothetical protein